MKRFLLVIAATVMVARCEDPALAQKPSLAPAATKLNDETQAQILREAVDKINGVAAEIEKSPAPPANKDWLKWPQEPVPVGMFAEFEIAHDIKAFKWVALSRSMAVPHPRIKPDSNGHEAIVQTALPGDYIVQVFGLRETEPVYLLVEFHIGPPTVVQPPDTPPVVTPPVVTPPVDPSTKVTAVTYFYDRDQAGFQGIPPAVMFALDKLNTSGRGIVATAVDADPEDGGGDIPEQHKVSYPRAVKEGFPVLISMIGDRVFMVSKDPRTEQQVMEVAP